MFLVATITYPVARAKIMAQKFTKSVEKPLPPFIRRLYVLTSSGGELGIKVLAIYEVEDAKLKDGIKELVKFYVQSYGDVEGFQYDIEPMLPAAEAIPLIGP
jgi:hypothetical protein